MGVGGVGLCLQLQVRPVTYSLVERIATQRADAWDQGGRGGHILGRVARPDIPDGHESPGADVNGERRLWWRLVQQAPPAAQHIQALVEWEVELDGQAARARVMEPEL